MMSKHRLLLATMIAVSLLAACSTSSQYQPRPPGGLVGYTDLPLAPDRYRVSFSGSRDSTRDDVEDHLLRRAAEVTLSSGYTHFLVETSDTAIDTRRVGDAYIYGLCGSSYDPKRSSCWDPPYGGRNTWPLRSYLSFAEIRMMRRGEATTNPDAIDAQAFLQSLTAFGTLPVALAAR